MNTPFDTERLSELGEQLRETLGETLGEQFTHLRERAGDIADDVRERLGEFDGERVMRGAIAGFLAGLAGTWCMGAMESAWNRVEAQSSSGFGHDGRAGGAAKEHRNRQENAGAGAGAKPQQSEPRSHHHRITPGERLAATFSRTVLHQPIDPRTRELAGSALHYAFGGCAGALYGAAAEIDDHVTAGTGTLFGAAVWLLADEIGISMTGLAPSPRRTPPRRHAYSLAAHLAFGFGTELTRRIAREII